MKCPAPRPRQGRPRAFDESEALEQAMRVFWEKGYDAASLADLTAAMGINPPSLYAAFGNKEALFLRVLERYGECQGAYLAEALGAPTAREVAERKLFGQVEALCDASHPLGCFAVQAVARSGDASSPMGQKLVSFCQTAHEALVKRLRRAKAEGDLPPESDPAALARFLTTVAQGLSLQAASGARRTDLRRVVEIALQAWPGSCNRKLPR
jgi:AcrR family transcriptional regulator